MVCVDEAYHEERLDPGLARLVPASVEVVKVPAVSSRLTRPLGFGEISLRAWRPLRQTVMRLLETRSVGAVLISGSPYYPMLLAGEIGRRFRVPVVLDFQDPWVSAWGATLPRWSKGGFAHMLGLTLEARAVQSADFVTSVSETQNAEMRARYPWLDANRMAAIPIGGDPEDFDALQALHPSSAPFFMDASQINFSYVGTICPPMLNALRALLIAATEVRSRRPEIYSRMRLNFIGTSCNSCELDGSWVRPIAKEVGVADIVTEQPRRIPYLDALKLQARSHAILMLGSDEPHYTASKIYGAMMAQRPFLSLFHESSSSHQILSRAGGGIALGFDGAAALPELVAPLADAIVRIASAPDTLGRANPSAYESYTARAVAQSFAKILDSLTPSQAAR